MSAQVMLSIAASVCFVSGGILLGLAFALKFRSRTKERLARAEEFYRSTERLAA